MGGEGTLVNRGGDGSVAGAAGSVEADGVAWQSLKLKSADEKKKIVMQLTKNAHENDTGKLPVIFYV